MTASRFIASRAVAIGQDTVRVTVFFFLMLYLLFFFLRDGQRLLEGLVRALPLGDERERLLMGRFAEVSRATIKGTIVVGIVTRRDRRHRIRSARDRRRPCSGAR